MDDQARLRLIVEAVIYCQRVRALGMPASCYSKALREPVFFLWEARRGGKEKAARFRSEAAKGLRFGSRRLIYDHAVPFCLLQDSLLALESPDGERVRVELERFGTTVLITPEEDAALRHAGLSNSMPADWDGKDVLARYRAVGIPLADNVSWGGERDA